MLRLFPLAALALLVLPVAAGTAGILLPAFGVFPPLGRAELSLQPFRDLAAMPGLARSAALSLFTGLAATLFASAIVLAFIAGWRGTRTFRVLQRLVSPLLSVPHAAAAFGLAFLIAPSGFLARLVSPWPTGWERPPDLLIVNDRLGLTMTAALVVKEIPFLFLMALAALPQTRAAEMDRLMASLGYGRMKAFFLGVLPLLYRQIRLAVLAVLAYATSVVDVALILGPTTPAPLAPRILAWRGDPDLDGYFVAAAGAVLQIGVTGLAVLVWIALEQVAGPIMRAVGVTGRRARRDGWLRHGAALAMAASAGTVLAGLLLLALWSVAGPWRFPDALPAGWTLRSWTELLPVLAAPLRDTLALAAASSLIAVALTLGSLEHHARKGRTDASRAFSALYVPLLVPQVAFLSGLQILFSVAGLDSRFAAVLLAHLVFVFPYVLLSLSDPWWSLDPRYAQAVRALGRGPAVVFWRVRLPLLLRPAATAAALGFAVSVALYLPTLLIGGGRWPTITTEAVALASGGDRRLIGVTGLIQALLPFLGFALAAMVSAFLHRDRRLMRASE